MKNLCKQFICLGIIIIGMSHCTRNLILLSPEDEFALGDYYLDQGEYVRASRQFEKIRTQYPTSQYATISQIKLAETLFARKHFDEAALDFGLFLEFHPAHRLAPYAQYHLALSRYKSMLNPERDITIAKEALIEFDKFLQMYPESEDYKAAVQYRNEIEDHLLTHEYLVARLYFRLREYEAVLARLTNIPERAHSIRLKQDASFLKAQVEEQRKNYPLATQAYQKVIDVDPESKLAFKAKKRMKELPSKPDLPDPDQK